MAVVLVKPSRAVNVGGAARAMKTMGFRDLYLVGCDLHLHPEAHWVAHGAEDILDGAKVFADLSQVRQQFDLLVATTARERGSARHYLSPQQLAAQLNNQLASAGRVALVFGSEESGLSNADLAHCDLYSSIPLASPYPSLNLAQAVMIYTYSLSGLRENLGLSDQSPEAGQLRALHERASRLLDVYLGERTAKLDEWLADSLVRFSDRDVRMAHTLIALFESAFNKNST